MHGIKRMIAAGLILLMLGGCAMDVESYLQPPRAQGQQQALQDALEVAILRDPADSYTFKYPASGELSSAFVLLDHSGNLCDADDAITAVAFYAYGSGEYTHLHLLRRDGDGWYSVGDTESSYMDIDTVQVCDLDGDGRMELLVGWDLYSGEHRLSVYFLDSTRLVSVPDVGRYNAYFAGDMNTDGRDELLLLNTREAGAVTASLNAWDGEQLVALGSTHLDRSIQSFEKLLYGKLTNGGDALYIDAMLSGGHYITELVYWDGQQLCSPLCDPEVQVTTVSARAAQVFCMDANGNGVPEFPVTSRLSGAPQATADDTWLWLTEWMSWDVAAGKAVRQFGSIVNREDGYFIELEDEWIPTVSTRYDRDAHILWLDAVQEDGTAQPFLAVQDTTGRKALVEVDGYTFAELPGNETLRIWYDPDSAYRLTTEKISYMLVNHK